MHTVHSHVCGRAEVATVADEKSHCQDESCDDLQLTMHVKDELQVLCCVHSLAAANQKYDVVQKRAILLQHACVSCFDHLQDCNPC